MSEQRSEIDLSYSHNDNFAYNQDHRDYGQGSRQNYQAEEQFVLFVPPSDIIREIL